MDDRMSVRGGIDRRMLLSAGGAGVGLVVAWTLWPRRYAPNLHVAAGEHVFDAYLKIGEDGRVTIAVGQAEMGQGVYTALPQILADELGADWRTVAVEPAPIHPLFANRLLAAKVADDVLPGVLSGLGAWAASELAVREALIITAESTSVSAFEGPLRAAGATARALLCMAAAKRWGIDWQACDARDGFVSRGVDRLRFAALAADAAGMTAPSEPPLRIIGTGGLSGRSLQRLDVPAKVDGSARFAGDVRLPGMMFASIRQGPTGWTTLAGSDHAAADRVPGVVAVLDSTRWAAAVANTWWAADRAASALRPRFETRGLRPDDASIDRALSEALGDGDAARMASHGDADGALGGNDVIAADYAVAMAPHAAIEPMVATARVVPGLAELWVPTQAPTAARAAVANAIGLREDQVVLYPMLHGGSFGRKIEIDAAVQAAVIATRIGQPIQLTWSRAEDSVQNRPAPPARARMRARVAGAGIAAWQARIAAPGTSTTLAESLRWPLPSPGSSDRTAIAGAAPPYAIPSFAVDHVPADIGIRTGLWRSASHRYTAFFTESFIDELAAAAGVDPLSFRIGMLGDNPRLARVLSSAAARGGWDGGGPGSGQGLAAHSAFGSHIAMLVEAHVDDNQRIIADRVVAAVDCGRTINPDVVQQQIEGGIVFALGGATGGATTLTNGVVDQRNFDAFALPTLASCPEIIVELISSTAPPGGVGELAVPPLAPALANALFAATGRRLRRLPLSTGA